MPLRFWPAVSCICDGTRTRVREVTMTEVASCSSVVRVPLSYSINLSVSRAKHRSQMRDVCRYATDESRRLTSQTESLSATFRLCIIGTVAISLVFLLRGGPGRLLRAKAVALGLSMGLRAEPECRDADAHAACTHIHIPLSSQLCLCHPISIGGCSGLTRLGLTDSCRPPGASPRRPFVRRLALAATLRGRR